MPNARTRSTRRPAAVKDAALTVAVRRRPRLGRPRVRRLRGQHDPAAVPAVRARHRGAQLPPQTAPTIGDRLSAAGRRLGLVLGRLVERRRRRRRARLDERQHAGHLHRPGDGDRRGLPELPEQALPVPPPAVQLLRDVRAGHRRARAGTCATRPSSSRSPARRGSTASSSRSASIKPVGAENEHPGYASEHDGADHLVELLQAIEGSELRQGHDGHRHLRRVRRPVGSRPAAGPGRDDARPARRDGARARASRR